MPVSTLKSTKIMRKKKKKYITGFAVSLKNHEIIKKGVCSLSEGGYEIIL